MKSINCPNCGNKLNEGALFCGSCGQKIIQPIEEIKIEANFCSKCGREFEKDEKFCAECGTSIDADITKNKQTSQKNIIPQSKPQPIAALKSNPSKKMKKGGFIKLAGKILLGIVILFTVGVILLLAFDNGASKPSKKISDSEIINEEESNSTENQKEKVLDVNDENRADKYRLGIDVQPDQYKALELYKEAANKGDLNAMVQLSDYYEQGIWTKKDTKKARQLLQQAASAGSLAAKWQLEFLESEK